MEERIGGERAGGDDEKVVPAAVERRHFPAHDVDVRLPLDGPRHLGREALAVDGEGVARGNARELAAADHE